MITKFLVGTAFTIAAKIITIAVLLMTIAASYAGHINPRIWAFPAILSLTLPYLAFATVVLIIYWVIRRKIIFSCLCIGTVFLCMPALSQAFPLSFKSSADKGEKTFKLLTWNILHTEDQEYPESKENRAVEFLTNCGADIICLQEMISVGAGEIRHWNPQMERDLRAAYPYAAGTSGSDIKILSKYPVTLLPSRPRKDGRKTRFYEFIVEIEGHKLHIVNVHLISYSLSSTDREILSDIRGLQSAKESGKKFKATVLNKLKSAFRLRADNAADLRDYIDNIHGPLIICGDFNDVPSSWAYRTVRGDDLKDAYVETSFGPAFTYNANFLYFHIDQILYRGPLKALSVEKEKIRTSDHYPLMATFAFISDDKCLK